MACATYVGLLGYVEKGGDGGIPRDDCEPGRQRTCSLAEQEFRPCLDVGPQDRRMWIKLAPSTPCVSTQPLVREGMKHASVKPTFWSPTSATHTVLKWAGISHRVPGWKASAMLAEW